METTYCTLPVLFWLCQISAQSSWKMIFPQPFLVEFNLIERFSFDLRRIHVKICLPVNRPLPLRSHVHLFCHASRGRLDFSEAIIAEFIIKASDHFDVIQCSRKIDRFSVYYLKKHRIIWVAGMRERRRHWIHFLFFVEIQRARNISLNH